MIQAKSGTTSMTLQYAWKGTMAAAKGFGMSAPTGDEQPLTYSEQYWASRALVAETLLAAREVHHMEIHELTLKEEAKRTVRLSAVSVGEFVD